MNDVSALTDCLICKKQIPGPNFNDLYFCDDCEIFIKHPSHDQATIRELCKDFLLSACSSEEKTNKRIRKAHEQLDVLEQHAAIGRVFDVGAAAGFFMKAARDRGWKVGGNEVSTAAIKWGKEKFGLRIRYGFFEDLMHFRKYDAVVMWNTLEHTTDPIKTLETAFRILKPRGAVFIRVPCRTLENVVQHYEKDHLYEFSLQSLNTLLQNTGFEKVSLNLVEDIHEAMDALYIKPARSPKR